MMDLLDSIPEKIRPTLAEALTQWGNPGSDLGEILDSFKSLGREKIMALHQAQKKRRSYDQDPHLYQIANTFLIIPEVDRVQFAKRYLEFISVMVDYMAECDTFDVDPKEADLRKMRDLFVEKDEDAVRAYLEEIHKPYYDKLESGQETIVASDTGLRIRETLD